MADLDIAFGLVFLQVAVCIKEKNAVLLDVVIRFIVSLTKPCKLFLGARAVIIDQRFDFRYRKHFVSPLYSAAEI
jgi:hypothetical protein